ncbi:MAG: hypothetical protein M9926_09975 [Lentimicrobium sp.]|nr:hypothetical protein [Lentimicrobium sp.]MCO5257074.1 hypothetical protein [Lentimicrobium sp.]
MPELGTPVHTHIAARRIEQRGGQCHRAGCRRIYLAWHLNGLNRYDGHGIETFLPGSDRAVFTTM